MYQQLLPPPPPTNSSSGVLIRTPSGSIPRPVGPVTKVPSVPQSRNVSPPKNNIYNNNNNNNSSGEIRYQPIGGTAVTNSNNNFITPSGSGVTTPPRVPSMRPKMVLLKNLSFTLLHAQTQFQVFLP
jgi:hypothetical protein